MICLVLTFESLHEILNGVTRLCGHFKQHADFGMLSFYYDVNC